MAFLGTKSIKQTCYSQAAFRMFGYSALPMVHALTSFVLVILVACSSAQPVTDALAVAEKELGKEIDAFPSQTGQYVLYIQRSSSATPHAALRFLVIEKATARIAERQSFMPGYVKWVGEDSVEVLSMPGIVKEGEDLSAYKKVIRIKPIN